MKDIPIIAFSIYALARDRKKFVAACMHDCQATPVVTHDLASALQRVLYGLPGWIVLGVDIWDKSDSPEDNGAKAVLRGKAL